MDLLEQELQMIVSCHVDAGNQTWVPLQEQQVLLTAELAWEAPSASLSGLWNRGRMSLCLSSYRVDGHKFPICLIFS